MTSAETGVTVTEDSQYPKFAKDFPWQFRSCSYDQPNQQHPSQPNQPSSTSGCPAASTAAPDSDARARHRHLEEYRRRRPRRRQQISPSWLLPPAWRGGESASPPFLPPLSFVILVWFVISQLNRASAMLFPFQIPSRILVPPPIPKTPFARS